MIRLVSSDLNGTLVHQHTMMDMIRVGFPEEPERFEQAQKAFIKQTSGTLSMAEAFRIAGPLTKGLRLRIAIEYALVEMKFLNGFEDFIRTLRQKGICFVINSTGYSITTEVIKAVYGPEYFHGAICNRLMFGQHSSHLLEEKELSDLIVQYVSGKKNSSVYDEITAIGQVELRIRDENEKARLIFEMADNLKIPRTSIVHIGDTLGDSGGICEVARHGGTGIAFNYNEALKTYLEKILRAEPISGKIFFVSPKSASSDIRSLLPILAGDT